MKQILINGLLIDLEKKRIKNLYLRILPPEGKIRISAPIRMSDAQIKQFVLSKKDWILLQQEKVQLSNVHRKIDFLTGDQIMLWGKHYPLVVKEITQRSMVHFDGDIVELSVKKDVNHNSPQHRESILNEWYRKELKDKLPAMIQKWESVIGVVSSDFTIRDMKTRWGTCNVRTKRICFNLQLVKKSPRCVEYVVVHELVHLLERSHNHVFKTYMDHYLPDWRMIKKDLNNALI